MPKPQLREPHATLESELITTLLAGLKEWRPDLDYPESYSDMQACARAALRMFEIKRRPIAVSLPIHCDLCNDTGYVRVYATAGHTTVHEKKCQCRKDAP